MTWNALREPALIVAGVLAPTVQTLLLVWGRLSDEQQAIWNSVTVALAGVIIALLAGSERLAPAVLGLATAVISLATFYGWHPSAGADTAITSTLSLIMAGFLRTQITAKIDSDGLRPDDYIEPLEPEPPRTVADLVAANGPQQMEPSPPTRPFQRIPPPGAPPPPRTPPQQYTQPPANPMWYADPAGPQQYEEGTGMRG